MTCYIVSHSNLLLNAIFVCSSEALLYRSYATPLLVVDVVGELWSEQNSFGIARFPCGSTAFLF